MKNITFISFEERSSGRVSFLCLDYDTNWTLMDITCYCVFETIVKLPLFSCLYLNDVSNFYVCVLWTNVFHYLSVEIKFQQPFSNSILISLSIVYVYKWVFSLFPIYLLTVIFSVLLSNVTLRPLLKILSRN